MTGLIYVVFGDKFDYLAAHTIAYSRQFTRLPITVITNIAEGARDKKWREVDGIDFVYVDMPVEENREIKTTIIERSPYENTLYMDADSIIQNECFDSDIERYFKEDFDLLLNYYCCNPTEDNKFQNIYLRAFNQFGCNGRMKVYNGAIIGFRKTDAANELFTKWNGYWKEFGKEREMPPLACAIMNTNLKVAEFDKGFFYSDYYLDTSIVQHNSNDCKFWDKIKAESIPVPITPHREDDYNFTQL